MLFKKGSNICVRSTATQCEKEASFSFTVLVWFLLVVCLNLFVCFLRNRHPAVVRFCSRKLSPLMVSQHPKVIISLSSLITFAQLIFSFAFSPFFPKTNKPTRTFLGVALVTQGWYQLVLDKSD